MSRDPELPSQPAVGFLVADRYELIEHIGEGGMGTVWRARDTRDARQVAVKLVGESYALDAPARRRFEREAKVLSRLGQRCAHVVSVFEHGVAPGIGPYLVMELLSGASLAGRLSARLRMPPTQVVRIFNELCAALLAAHAAGVIHRDVKPANVYLHRPAEGAVEMVKLLDFGVAKQRIDNEQSVLTHAGTVLGTPLYMSPEQLLGDSSLDARADLWSAGVLVYRMLTGRTPFSGTSAELAASILAQEPPKPSLLVPGLPAELDAWMARALAKRPADRFQDAGTMSDELALLFGDALEAADGPTLGGAVRSPMRPRQAKGVNLIDLVKLLRSARRAGSLPELSAADQALLDERVLVSKWYPIESFWRLLELAHEHVLGRSDEATVRLGVVGAESVMSGVHRVYVAGQDLERALKGFARGWGSYFDFGFVKTAIDGRSVRIEIHGYADMPRTHGLTTLGWMRTSLGMVTGELDSAEIVGEPWAGDPVYAIAMVLRER